MYIRGTTRPVCTLSINGHSDMAPDFGYNPQKFRYWAGTPPGVGRISFFGSRTLYPLCTLWGVACAKSSDLTPIRAGVVGKFSGRVPVHAGEPARYRKSMIRTQSGIHYFRYRAGFSACTGTPGAKGRLSPAKFRYRAGTQPCTGTRPENFPTTPARMGVKSELFAQATPHNVQRGYNVRDPKKEILPTPGGVPAQYRNSASQTHCPSPTNSLSSGTGLGSGRVPEKTKTVYSQAPTMVHTRLP
jgi:hypothetical protein